MKYTENIINSKLKECNKSHIIALSKANNMKDKVIFHCTIHNIDYKQSLDDAIHKKYGCPECLKEGRNKTLLDKHNLLKDRPDIAELLLDRSMAPYIHTYEKSGKYWFVCPKCGSKLYKSVFNVVQNGLKCDKCSDGFYYPNKLMFNILEQLGIDFEPEYSPEWISPKRYDFYFELNGNNYIVEMDGGLGHGKKSFGNKEDPSVSKQNDKYKDEQAFLHGYIVIRIDSDPSELQYIKNNIEDSILNGLLDLNKIDWVECDKKAQSSILIDVCRYYDENDSSLYDLAQNFGLHHSTIQKYLKIGHELGLIKKYVPHLQTTSIVCIESQIIFNSISEAARYYDIDSSGIAKVCLGKRHSIGKLHFKYLADCDDYYTRNLKPNYNVKAVIEKNEKIPIIILDLLDNTEMEFESICSAAKYLGKHDSTISRAINNRRPYLNRYVIKKSTIAE